MACQNALGIDGFDSVSPGMKANLRTMRFMVRAREPWSAAMISLCSPFSRCELHMTVRYFWNDGRVYRGEWANNRTPWSLRV